MASAGMGLLVGSAIIAPFTSRNISSGMIRATAEDMDHIKQLLEKGKLKPVIDKTYSLEQIALAHTHVDTGQKKGNVIISVFR